MLAGCQPRAPVPRLVAGVLSWWLQREVSIAECGFVNRNQPTHEVDDSTQTSATPEGTMTTVAKLTWRNLNRRTLMIGTMFTASTFAEPALLALATPPRLVTAKTDGQRIGMADVETVLATTEHYNRLGMKLGGRRVLDQVVRFLHDEANRTLHGSYTEQTGRALFSAVAQATRVAGVMADDAGRPALAQRYYVQAFNLAMHANDRHYAGRVLACASRLAIRIGQCAATERDAVHNARHAVALARTARSVAGSSAPPLLATQLYAVEARGLALLGDTQATTTAVDAAMRTYDTAKPANEPHWLSTNSHTYSQMVLFTELGPALRDIGCVNRAIGMFDFALGPNGLAPYRLRDRAMAQTDLAMTYLAQGELDGMITTANQAMHTAEPIASHRVHDRIQVLQHRLQPHLNRRTVADTNDQITDFLTRRDTKQSKHPE